MKILMLTPYLPYPPASGGQIRTLYLLKYLGKNHDITLVSLYKMDSEKKYAEYLRTYCKDIYLCKRAEKPWKPSIILKAIFSGLPFLIVRNFSQEAIDTIKYLLERNKYDVIHAETFYIMPHIPKTTTPVLLVEQTIEYKVYQHFISTLSFIFRIPLSLDIFKLKYWEKFYWSKATLVATVSEADQKEITKLLPSIKSVIIPNGAGDDMFATTFPKFNRKNPTLLFVGNFSWLQNIEAAEYLLHHVLPEIRKKIPEVEVVIAGQNSTKKLSTTGLENVKIVALDPDNIGQVKKLYESATLFIAPIFGPGGTRLKILASMASGLPVISTKTGVSGLGVENEKHCLIAQNPQEFITEILKVLDDENLYKSIQKNAFEMVKKEYSWKTIAQKLENVYKGIMH